MKYFLHDTSAFQDEKITELFIKHGYEGLGLFYTILEKIALQEKPIKTSILKKQLQVGKRLEKVWQFLEEISLISTKNGDTFNERILSYSNKYQINREKNRERVLQFREKQDDTKNVTHFNDDCNASVTPVKVSKEIKEIKVSSEYIFPSPDFEIELSPVQVQRVTEYLQLTKQKAVTPEQAVSLFAVFKEKHFTGAKSYKDKGDIFKHFFDSLKYEQFNGTVKHSSNSNSKSAGAYELLEETRQLYSRRKADSGA